VAIDNLILAAAMDGVRGKHARELLGWVPKRTSVVEWIRDEMV